MEQGPADEVELQELGSEPAGHLRRRNAWFVFGCVVLVALAVAGIVIAAGSSQEPAADDATETDGTTGTTFSGTGAPLVVATTDAGEVVELDPGAPDHRRVVATPDDLGGRWAFFVVTSPGRLIVGTVGAGGAPGGECGDIRMLDEDGWTVVSDGAPIAVSADGRHLVLVRPCADGRQDVSPYKVRDLETGAELAAPQSYETPETGLTNPVSPTPGGLAALPTTCAGGSCTYLVLDPASASLVTHTIAAPPDVDRLVAVGAASRIGTTRREPVRCPPSHVVAFDETGTESHRLALGVTDEFVPAADEIGALLVTHEECVDPSITATTDRADWETAPLIWLPERGLTTLLPADVVRAAWSPFAPAEPTTDTTVAAPDTSLAPLPTTTDGPCSAWGLEVGDQDGLIEVNRRLRTAALDALSHCDLEAFVALQSPLVMSSLPPPPPALDGPAPGSLDVAGIQAYEQRGVPLTAAIVAALGNSPVCPEPPNDAKLFPCLWLGHLPSPPGGTQYVSVTIGEVFSVMVQILSREDCVREMPTNMGILGHDRPPADWPVC